MAALVELLHSHRNVTAMAGGAKQHQLPQPLKIPRPGDDRKPREMSPQELREWLASRREVSDGEGSNRVR